MKAKILSLILLNLGWLPSAFWLYADVYFLPNEQSMQLSQVMQWLCMVILPGLGGLLAGWSWNGAGLVISTAYLFSAIFATPFYMSWVTSWKLPPGHWLEGPVGLLLLMMAVPGTGVSLVGALVGMFARNRHQLAKVRAQEGIVQK